MRLASGGLRFVIAGVVLYGLSHVVPGFSPLALGWAVLAALVIAGIGWLMEGYFGASWSPYGDGVANFIVVALIIYVTQSVIPGMRISFVAAFVSALVISVLDAVIPLAVR
ncbi:MAG: phage holin family protein [Sulfobacillus sp.]